jgi:hypothetical protein
VKCLHKGVCAMPLAALTYAAIRLENCAQPGFWLPGPVGEIAEFSEVAGHMPVMPRCQHLFDVTEVFGATVDGGQGG